MIKKLIKILFVLFVMLSLFFADKAIAAVSYTHKTTSGATNNTTSYTIASTTPTANALILLWVDNRNASGAPDTPTITGNNLTWVQATTTTHHAATAGDRRFTLFRAMGSSPTAGTTTISYTNNQNNVGWTMVEFAGVDTSGTNGSGAIAQSTSSISDDTADITITLNTFSGTSNITAGGFVNIDNSQAIVAGSGFTIAGQWQATGENLSVASEVQLANDTTVDASIGSGTTRWGGIAVEVVAAPPSVDPPKMSIVWWW